MISIQITCPFRYQYNGTQNKDIFFMAGEYYHLDAEKDKNEVKKILSPNFQFKEYIHVNQETLPKEYVLDSSLEESNSFHSNPNPEEIEYISTLIEGTKSTEQIEDPGPDYEEPYTLDPDENKFESEINNQKIRKDYDKKDSNNVSEEDEEEPITPDLAPVEEEEEPATATETFKDGEIEERRDELDKLHYTKIQDIAEQYGIVYSKKDKTVEDILRAEFDIPTDIQELEGQFKEDPE